MNKADDAQLWPHLDYFPMANVLTMSLKTVKQRNKLHRMAIIWFPKDKLIPSFACATGLLTTYSPVEDQRHNVERKRKKELGFLKS